MNKAVKRISRQPFYRNLLLSLFFCGIFAGPAMAAPPDRWIELGYQWATLNDETGRFLEGGFQLTHWGPVGLGARLNVMLGDVGSPFDLKQGRLNCLWYGGLLLSYEEKWRWAGLSLNTLAGFGFAEQEKRDFDVTGLGEIGLGILQPGVGLRFSVMDDLEIRFEVSTLLIGSGVDLTGGRAIAGMVRYFW